MVRNRNLNIIYNILIFILVGVLCFSAYKIFVPSDEYSIDGIQEEDYHHIKVSGKKYKYKTTIINILFLGIDTTSTEDIGQSDSIGLVVLNREDKNIKIIPISRDTMCDIKVYDANHNFAGWKVSHLNLQYAFGTDPKNGSFMSCQAVSRIFHNIPVNQFVSMDMSKLSDIQGIVGDLEVVVPNNSMVEYNPEWYEGAIITINCDNVEKFIRSRDIEIDYSNRDRMERQKAYLNAYFKKINELLSNDFDSTVKNIYNVLKTMTTNITFEDAQSYAEMFMTYSFDSNSDFITIKGEDKVGLLHDEFYVDDESLQDLILNIFYKEE